MKSIYNCNKQYSILQFIKKQLTITLLFNERYESVGSVIKRQQNTYKSFIQLLKTHCPRNGFIGTSKTHLQISNRPDKYLPTDNIYVAYVGTNVMSYPATRPCFQNYKLRPMQQSDTIMYTCGYVITSYCTSSTANGQCTRHIDVSINYNRCKRVCVFTKLLNFPFTDSSRRLSCEKHIVSRR